MFINPKTIRRSFLPIYKIYNPPAKNIPKGLDLFKQYKSGALKRALTFQQKCLIINDPKMIAHIEMVEYGMTFKPTKRIPVAFLILGALIITYLYKSNPHPISERYFSISQQSQEYKFGYLGSMFSFSSIPKFLSYAPAFVAVSISSRYLKTVDFVILMILGCLGNYVLGTQQIQKKLKSFQVWDRYKITSGEKFTISIITTLLCYRATSITDLFNNPRLRLFFKAVPGFGITSSGIAIIAPLLLYIGYEAYSTYRKNESMSLLVYYISIGALYGFTRRLLFKS